MATLCSNLQGIVIGVPFSISGRAIVTSSSHPASSRSFSLVFKSRRHNAAVIGSNDMDYGGQWRKQAIVIRSLSSGQKRESGRSRRINCSSNTTEGTEEEEKKAEMEYLGELRVPEAWVDPEVAAREAEWLRVALHQWLDDEFCPEPANEEISTRCSKVYYYCLLEQQLDIGDILMQMVRGLETFSFKESFHGAFSSANAAIDLITRRMRSVSLEDKDNAVDSSEAISDGVGST